MNAFHTLAHSAWHQRWPYLNVCARHPEVPVWGEVPWCDRCKGEAVPVEETCPWVHLHDRR